MPALGRSQQAAERVKNRIGKRERPGRSRRRNMGLGPTNSIRKPLRFRVWGPVRSARRQTNRLPTVKFCSKSVVLAMRTKCVGKPHGIWSRIWGSGEPPGVLMTQILGSWRDHRTEGGRKRRRSAVQKAILSGLGCAVLRVNNGLIEVYHGMTYSLGAQFRHSIA
ncbi:hypothetical protein ASPSYDRAFT_671660 [Aspergillus sydowii CBS 593.65]|uniref:Uncharacterized protein n=1 Tax=Aspergillus sydowii CBS 593.65 TaxID=1036612 RepID=A0A1L9TU01_9EURO|nr:uncharacterized protein ASPSYDRAFT_671660 [Aspergillus sydowii CBS 593.65]OJJ62855.1 hypothetical protein ASPSYDRAFT_671660 [Aspergillus sydowii CBS 593.65]